MGGAWFVPLICFTGSIGYSTPVVSYSKQIHMSHQTVLERERPLLGLLNHNLLPLTGREELLDELIQFIRRTSTGEELGLCLITGEAGIGKTRLAAALVEKLQEGGVVPFRIRFYPESDLDVSRLCGLALDSLSTEPSRNSGGSPIERLRRWCLTRQSVLIFEDAHLLSGEAIGAFGRFLYALSDIPLPVLLLTRPVSDTVRGVIEPHRRSEIEMQGLNRDEIALLWNQLFDTKIAEEDVEIILTTTAGNPLALRSGFRLTAEGMMAKGEGGKGVERNIAEGAFRRGAGLLAEGLIAHLSAAERRGAETLAPLGEVFDVPTARSLLRDDPEILDQLRFKGILRDVGYGEVHSLTEDAGHRLALGFTHTLIHGVLLEANRIDPAQLIPLLKLDVPLYAFTPLRLMRGILPIGVAPADLYAFGRVVLKLSFTAENGGDPVTTGELMELIEEIGRVGEDFSFEDRLDLELNLCRLRLNNRSGWKETAEFRRRVDDALEQYQELPEPLLRHRVGLLRYRQILDYNQPLVEMQATGRLWDGWEEVQQLLKGHPGLRLTTDYARFLGTVVQVAVFVGDQKVLAQLDREVNYTLSLPELEREQRGIILMTAVARLTSLYNSEETFRVRREQIEMIEAEFPSLRVTFQRLSLVMENGNYREGRKLATEVRARAEREGMVGLLFAADAILLLTQDDPDISVEENLNRIELLWESYRERVAKHYRKQVCELLLDLLITNNRPDILPVLHQKWGDLFYGVKPNRSLYVAIHLNPEMLPEVLPRFLPTSLHASLLRYYFNVENDLADDLIERLRMPILRQVELIELWGILKLVALIDREKPGNLSLDFRSALADRAHHALSWLAERGSVPTLNALFQEVRSLLTDDRSLEWQKLVDQLNRKFFSRSSSKSENLLLSVIGTFAFSKGKSERKELRGGRLHAISGALVVAVLLREKLDRQAFMELASGEPYSRQSRKMVNTGVFRLREAIGRDAVLTDEEGLPRLNLAILHVDVLQLVGIVEEAEREFAEGKLARAAELIEGGLELAAKGPLFPGLYDPLYDTLRDDIESRLRESALRIGRELVAEGAIESAIRIGRGATVAMPGDEELAELLREGLGRRHRGADAEVMREKELREEKRG